MTYYTKTYSPAFGSLARSAPLKTEFTLVETGMASAETAIGLMATAANPTFTGVGAFADGSVSAPSVTNTGDLNTGVYFPAADQVGIAAGGVAAAIFAATTVSFVGQVTTTGGYFSAGTTGSGTGGNFRMVDDGGTTRWLAGILGSASERAYSIYDAVRAVAPISISGTTGAITVAEPASGDTLTLNAVAGGRVLVTTGTLSGAGVFTLHQNMSNTGSSDAFAYMRSGGASGGDVYSRYSVEGVTDWTFGIDNSDSDAFVVSASAGIGTSNGLRITTAGAVSVPGTLTVTGTSALGALSATTGTFTGVVSGITDLTTTGNTILGNAQGDTLNVAAGAIAVGASGNVTMAAPASGVGLTQTGFAGSDTALFNGGTSGSFRVTDRGLPYGTSIHNNAGAVTGTTNQYIASGTYTPTLSNTTNISASTARKSTWTRLGNVVRVSGSVQITVTTGTSATELGIELPIASNLAAVSFNDLNGSMTRSAPVVTAPQTCSCTADNTNNRSKSVWLHDANTGLEDWIFSFEYEVL